MTRLSFVAVASIRRVSLIHGVASYGFSPLILVFRDDFSGCRLDDIAKVLYYDVIRFAISGVEIDILKCEN